MAYAARSGMFDSFLEFQVGSCLYVTAAVRGGRPRACRAWSQRPKFVQGSLEPVASLVPPFPFPPPFLSFFWGGFPEWNIQDYTFLSLSSFVLPKLNPVGPLHFLKLGKQKI